MGGVHKSCESSVRINFSSTCVCNFACVRTLLHSEQKWFVAVTLELVNTGKSTTESFLQYHQIDTCELYLMY
jgi:hypothetical protein